LPDIHGLDAGAATERVGTVTQYARVDRFIDDDGASRGARRMRVMTGGGLEFDLHPDRALDVGAAWYRGVPLAWLASPGFTPAAAAEPEGRGWLRTWGGGLVSTCGLDAFGAPATDDGVAYPMHGRIGTTPATVRRAEVTADAVVVEATTRQTGVFAENLRLDRRITAPIGGARLTIEDTVTNDAETAAGIMVLYHVNFGWPLVDDGAILDIPNARVAPRDPDAAAGFDERLRVGPPQRGFREQVYVAEAERAAERVATITNPRLGLRVTLIRSETLPALIEWKMLATRHYAIGFEPANTPVITGRADAHAAGLLPLLEPGAAVSYRIDLEVSEP